jgi:Fur family ferric uptake transcriptional regulator
MGSYKTIQKDSLLTFFRAHCHEAMTTHQIYQRMQIDSIDYVPGESTIYRLVKQLTDSGVLVRSIDPQSRQFLFRLAEGEQCCCKVRMQCKICGKIIEMDNDCSHKLLGKLLSDESFSADHEIIITGVCKDCK